MPGPAASGDPALTTPHFARPPATDRPTGRILYQRGVYPPEDFKQVKKYGLTLFTGADEALERYVQNVMKQVQSESCAPSRLLRAPCVCDSLLNSAHRAAETDSGCAPSC